MSAAEKQEEERPFIVWDTCEISTEEAKYRSSDEYTEERELEKPMTEDEAWSDIQDDPDFFEHEWDYRMDFLEEKMKEINPDERAWHVDVEGFGWRNLNGWTEFDTMDPRKFLRKILPDTDCTFQIFEREDETDGKTFYIRNWHHDSPMGESYYVRVKPEGEEEEDE